MVDHIAIAIMITKEKNRLIKSFCCANIYVSIGGYMKKEIIGLLGLLLSLSSCSFSFGLNKSSESSESTSLVTSKDDLDDFDYVVNEDGSLTLTKYKGNATSLYIPNNVSAIEGYTFYDNNSIEELFLPLSVTRIGFDAFASMFNLDIIYCEATSFLEGWDVSCHVDINKIVWGYANKKGISGDVRYAICNINGDEFATITGSVDKEATSINIPSNIDGIKVKEICDSAFRNSSLTSIDIPNGIETIGNLAFYSSNELARVKLAESISIIKASAFGDCCSLTSIELNEGLTRIEGSSFLYTSLTSISIPGSVNYIGDYAFRSCYKLTYAYISEGVTDIGEGIFEECSSLKEVTFPNMEHYLGYYFGSTDEKGSSRYVPDSLYKVTILGGEDIPDYAFDGCHRLTSIIFPSSIKRIGNNLFSSSGDQVIYSKASKEESSWYASFYYEVPIVWNFDVEGGEFNGLNYSLCKQNDEEYICISGAKKELAIIDIPSEIDGVSVKEIARYAFAEHEKIKEIFIPNSVTSIGESAFHWVSNIEKLTIPFANGCLLADYFDETDSNSYLYPRYLKEIVLSGGKYISERFFSGLNLLEKISLPKGLENIGSKAFGYCSSLTSLDLPNSVLSIGEYAFYRCRNLVSINIGNKLLSVGDYAFYCCSSLKKVILPSTVTYLGTRLFSECPSLEEVTLPFMEHPLDWYCLTGTALLKKITILGGDYIYFRRYGFIETVVLPLGLTSIVQEAFYDCSSLKNIVIPSSVTSIGGNAFCYCSSLESIFIPREVTSIGGYCFGQCPKLTIYCELEEEPSTYEYGWSGGCNVIWGYNPNK